MTDPQAPHNLFQSAETFQQLIGEIVGAGSVCWSEAPTGVFNEEQALLVSDDAMIRLQELIARHVVGIYRSAGIDPEMIIAEVQRTSGA